MTEWDILNWQAMIIELTIAGVVAIGLSIFFYRRQEKERKRIDSIIIEQEKSKKNRREFSISFIRSTLPEFEFLINNREELKKKLLKNIRDVIVDMDLRDNLDLLETEINNLKFQVTISADVLEPHYVEEIRHFIVTVDEYTKFELEYDVKPHIAGIKTNIATILKNWPNPRV